MPKFRSWGHEVRKWNYVAGLCGHKHCCEKAKFYTEYKAHAHTLSGERTINHLFCRKHAEAFATKYGVEMPKEMIKP
jgi:hypothetical protein